MINKSIRGLSFALMMAASAQAFGTLGNPEQQVLEVESAQVVSDLSQAENVDLAIEILAPEQATEYMQSAQLTDESLQRDGLRLDAEQGIEVQAADGPFGFFSDIFGGQASGQQDQYGRGRRGRRGRHAVQESAPQESGDFSLFGSHGGGTCSAHSGIASYYGRELSGHRTASGARFNPGAMTAAHRTLRFGTRVLVSHGGRSVVVTINDRGPFVRGRVIDLSAAAAHHLGLSTGYVTLQVLGCR